MYKQYIEQLPMFLRFEDKAGAAAWPGLMAKLEEAATIEALDPYVVFGWLGSSADRAAVQAHRTAVLELLFGPKGEGKGKEKGKIAAKAKAGPKAKAKADPKAKAAPKAAAAAAGAQFVNV